MSKPLSDDAKKLLLQYGEDTYTTEFQPGTPGLDELVERKLLYRHPDGPFGSRCSYFRTAQGRIVWDRLVGRI